MASVFITVSMISLFLVLKNRREMMMPVMEKYPPMTFAMGIVALSYPTWAVIGGALALLYRISLEQAPGGGMGSPNLAYTLAIAGIAILLAAPLAILFRRMLIGGTCHYSHIRGNLRLVSPVLRSLTINVRSRN